MATNNLGNLHAKITADGKQFEKEVGRARRSTQTFSKNAKEDFGKLSKGIIAVKAAVGGLIAAFATRALWQGLNTSLDRLDAINKGAGALGLTTDAYQELSWAMEQAGINNEQFMTGMRTFQRSIAEAARGVKTYEDRFSALNVELRDGNGNIKPTTELLQETLNALGGVGNAAQRASLSMELLSESGTRMLNVVREGPQYLSEMAQQAHEMGMVFEQDLIEQATKAKDQLNLMKTVLGAQFIRAFVSAAPAITNLGDQFTENLPKLLAWIETFMSMIGLLDEFSVQTIDVKLGSMDEEIAKAEAAVEAARARLGTTPTADERFRVANTDLEELNAERESLLQQRTEAEKRAAQRAEDIAQRHQENLARMGAGGTTVGGVDVPNQAAHKALEAERKRIADLREAYENIADPLRLYRLEREQLDEVFRKTDMSHDTYMEGMQEIAEREQAAMQTVDEYKEKLSEKAAALVASLDPYYDINEQERIYKQLLDEKLITESQYLELLDKSSEQRLKIAKDLEVTNSYLERMNDLVKESGMAFESAFEKAIIDGEKLSTVINALTQDLIRLALRAMVVEPLVGALSGFGSSLATGIQRSGMESAPGFVGPPSRAGGGVISPNTMTLVGERGPELIAANSPARVINNHQTRGMLGGKQDIKVEIINRGSPVEAVSSNTTMSAQGMIVSIVTDDMRRNGPISQGLSNLYGLRRTR